jgi:hypothetical protein
MGLRSGGYFGRYETHKFSRNRSESHEVSGSRRAAMDSAPPTSIITTVKSEIRMSVKRNLIQVLVPWSISAAIKEAAAHELTSNSGYIRRALVERLRADGVDPARFTPAEQTAAA